MYERTFHATLKVIGNAALIASTLAALHYLPRKQVSRPQAYAEGSAVLVGVPAVTMALSQAKGEDFPGGFWALLLALNTAVAGVTVFGAYLWDHLRQPGKRALSTRDVK